jgi:hypothetical protein
MMAQAMFNYKSLLTIPNYLAFRQQSQRAAIGYEDVFIRFLIQANSPTEQAYL